MAFQGWRQSNDDNDDDVDIDDDVDASVSFRTLKASKGG